MVIFFLNAATSPLCALDLIPLLVRGFLVATVLARGALFAVGPSFLILGAALTTSVARTQQTTSTLENNLHVYYTDIASQSYSR